jgi:hypothetical protein
MDDETPPSPISDETKPRGGLWWPVEPRGAAESRSKAERAGRFLLWFGLRGNVSQTMLRPEFLAIVGIVVVGVVLELCGVRLSD